MKLNIAKLLLLVLVFETITGCHSSNKPAIKDLTAMDYFVPVRIIQQNNNMNCWAAALSMIYSWKANNNTMSVEDILAQFGSPYLELYQNNTGINGGQEATLYQKAGLKTVNQSNPTIDYWYDLLKNRGPLSITISRDQQGELIHAIVVNGMKGDGSVSTKVNFVDPADGLQHQLTFDKFVTFYETGSGYPIQIIYWP